MPIQANIIYSKSIDPYVNLAIENWVFKNIVQEEPILFLWQSSPAIIIGRAQNPWLECNLKETTKDNIPIVRRQSGGGTVFHDLGNINFTFLMPNHLYDKKKHLQVIVSALDMLSIKTKINDRNDIITLIDKQPYKLSGSAYRETKHMSFHHGTLLINSDLGALEKYLHHKIDTNITAKGVSSVRSKVTSIKQIQPEAASIKLILNAIEESFKKHYQISYKTAFVLDDSYTSKIPDIENYTDSIKNWDWTYSKTLPFEYSIKANNNEKINIHIKQGRIIYFEHNLPENKLPKLIQFLNEQPYLNRETLNNTNPKSYNDNEKRILQQIMHLFTE